MSWVQDLASFAKRLITLESRVEVNAEEIKALRQDLQALTDFTRKVAYAVKRNEERAEDKRENLVLSLKLELSQLENRLNSSNQLSASNDSVPTQTALPESNSRSSN